MALAEVNVVTDTETKYLPKPRHGYGIFTSAFVNEQQCLSVLSFYENTFVGPNGTETAVGDENREKLQKTDISTK